MSAPKRTRSISPASPAAKRHRQTGSFSPASPPYWAGAKVANAAYSPQTPTSPPLMSSATQAQPYDSSNPTNHSTSDTQPAASTPATSIGGHVSFAKDKSSDGDIQMSGDISMDPGASADVTMTDSGLSEHRRSDHDRQGERYAETGKGNIAPLGVDDGRLYKLLQCPYPPEQPSLTENLIALYGLNDFADSVRRYDPITGAKINKLRKSYAGKLKELNIVGRTKNMEKDLPMPGVLIPGMMEPRDPHQWDMHFAAGHDLRRADFSLDKTAKRLDAAMKMKPGKLPDSKAHKWTSLIGLDEGAKAKNAVLDKQKKPLSARPSGAATPILEANAPVRTTRGVKRGYQESSFVGYAEGFGDEESDMTDVDSRPIKKKKFGKV